MSGQYSFFSALLLVASTSIGIPSAVQAGEVQDAMLKAADNEAGGAYVREQYLKLVKVPFDGNDRRKKALIIGDSHGQDLLNAITESNGLSNYQIRTRYIPNVCQMYLGAEDVSSFIGERDKAVCAKADSLEQAKQQIEQADLVILVASWKEWSAERLAQTISNMHLKPNQTLRVIGRKSFGKINVRSYVRMPEDKLAALRNPVDEHQQGINKTMKSTLSSTVFVDIQQIVCGKPDTCPVFTKDLRLISFDGGHLTKNGARYVGELLFQSPPLKGL